MQPAQSVPTTDNVALRQGLIFGISLAIIWLILVATNDFVDLGGFRTVLAYVLLSLPFVFYILTGFFAARITGSTRTGTWAGVWTGAIWGLANGLYTLIRTMFNVDTIRATNQLAANKAHIVVQYTNNQIILYTLLGALLAILLGVVEGAIFGAIGGTLGKGRKHSVAVVDRDEAPSEAPAPTLPE